ncbi:hypothetical protein H0H81_008475 [Sphagnurus paluster]|uniref:F-box domain-containing protein n=1 Tax=Sphagnurus paluster TaxID=117069 RepID=A0A9P7FSL9_9AGAR|nr:hypothetical protein H0H81_008475 [Sphagnurus paluster]
MHLTQTLSAATTLPKYLLSQVGLFTTCYIQRVPMDVFVDYIFPHLSVEEIMCLRRVNKTFFLLTHEPIIWKRFLVELNVNVPPIRPTFRYALKDTDFEFEQLVSRAISLEDNWRKKHTVPRSHASVFTNASSVLDMVILPGGKYLVASIHTEDRYWIVIYCLDHPLGPRAICRAPTRTKAFKLQAKYMKHEGKQVIMMTYVRRTWAEGGPTNIDPSEYGFKTKIDPAYPVVNELLCLSVSLDRLEALADPRLLPQSPEVRLIALAHMKGPFRQVASAIARHPIEHVSLYEQRGAPMLSLAQPDQLVIIDIAGSSVTTLNLGRHPQYQENDHEIRAYRVLPNQNEVLLFRTVYLGLDPASPEVPMVLNILEIFELPQELDGTCYIGEPKSLYILGRQAVRVAHISDYEGPSTHGEPYYLQAESQPLPPISVFMETQNPTAIIHYVVWPELEVTPQGVQKYTYVLNWVCFQTRHHTDPFVAHIIPGSFRCLVYTTHRDDRTDNPKAFRIRRYINPEFARKDYTVNRVNRHSPTILSRGLPKMPVNIYGTLPIPAASAELYASKGISAIAFDEGIGRVCIAAANTPQIEILDFSSAVPLDNRFHAWKRERALLN